MRASRASRCPAGATMTRKNSNVWRGKSFSRKGQTVYKKRRSWCNVSFPIAFSHSLPLRGRHSFAVLPSRSDKPVFATDGTDGGAKSDATPNEGPGASKGRVLCFLERTSVAKTLSFLDDGKLAASLQPGFRD